MATMGFCAFGSAASAQIITTSVPRAASAASPATTGDKKFAVHVMYGLLTQWRFNEIFVGANDFFIDFGNFRGKPRSDLLVAGEVAVALGRDASFGVGGWYNKVGKVTYSFKAVGITLSSGKVAFNEGILDGDLTLDEQHVNFFYKSFGVQAGVVRTRSEIIDSHILKEDGVDIAAKGFRLGTVEEVTKSTDYDFYGVYKVAGGVGYPWGISVGAGVYYKKGNLDTASRGAEDSTVFSAFATGSITLGKGLGFDVSYWYIGRTKATRGEGNNILGDDASRLMVGLGYTFSR